MPAISCSLKLGYCSLQCYVVVHPLFKDQRVKVENDASPQLQLHLPLHLHLSLHLYLHYPIISMILFAETKSTISLLSHLLLTGFKTASDLELNMAAVE